MMTRHLKREGNERFLPPYPSKLLVTISRIHLQLCREVLKEYTEKTKMLTELTSKAMAKSLNLDEKCFLNQFGERSILQARFNYYSKCQRPDLILGLKPHADGSGYTSILQDEVGLQVFNEDKWHTVPKVPHAILILMGDQMEVRTDTLHIS